jgi:dipeptidyl-peptidase-3
VLARADRLPPALREAVREYRRWLFVFHRLHDSVSKQKYAPPLSRAELAEALRRTDVSASPEPPAALFDPRVAPRLIDKAPGAGRDPLLASAANHYEGLALADLDGYPRALRADWTARQAEWRGVADAESRESGGVAGGDDVDEVPFQR